MPHSHPTQPPGDKMKKALQLLTELSRTHPDKSKSELLHIVGLRLDLTPRECEFLTTNFSKY